MFVSLCYVQRVVSVCSIMQRFYVRDYGQDQSSTKLPVPAVSSLECRAARLSREVRACSELACFLLGSNTDESTVVFEIANMLAVCRRSEVGSVFCLSWLITWFGHVVNGLDRIIRMYDFFIASHPLMPMYLAAAVVLYREKLLLSTECDMCILHSILSKVPDDLPFELLISRAGDLFLLYPPDQLTADTEKYMEQQRYVYISYASRLGFNISRQLIGSIWSFKRDVVRV